MKGPFELMQRTGQTAREEPLILTRTEVARMLGGKSLRFVDYLAAQGTGLYCKDKITGPAGW
jgi:hypothetical protein